MGQTIYQVDAFTDTPFSGNPAGVCLLEAAASEQWMQNIALEMNLSETAFLVPIADGFDLRWFTPAREVDLWAMRHWPVHIRSGRPAPWQLPSRRASTHEVGC